MNLKNRLSSKIISIKKGKLNAHISLQWNNIPLSVIITSTSVDELALSEDDDVDVLFKASDVILARNLKGSISARNILPGKIREIKRGFPLAMVVLDLDGQCLSAELTIGSVDDMNLSIGDEVEAVIKSSELILAK